MLYKDKEYNKKYRENNREKIKEYYQRPEVKEKRRKYRNKYDKEKRREDLNYKIRENLRLRLNFILNKYLKTGKIKSSKKYGVNYKEIILHLKPFPENIKEYEIDHIIPLSRFNFNNPEHIKIAFVPENHQWLIKEENGEKGNRLIMPH